MVVAFEAKAMKDDKVKYVARTRGGENGPLHMETERQASDTSELVSLAQQARRDVRAGKVRKLP